jgi:hypothetical protein
MPDSQSPAVTAQFYRRVVPLHNTEHANLRIATGFGFGYTSGIHAVYVTLAELPLVVRDYPIVFVMQGDELCPIAMLGLKRGENLFVDEQGAWQADYVPAYLRRYPFILADRPDNADQIVCMDADCPAVNTGEGERLFMEDGSQSRYLSRSIGFLREYQAHYQHTRKAVARLAELGLLEDTHAVIEPPGGKDKARVDGFMTVKRERLAELAPEKLAGLLENGLLDAIFLHRLSLDNFTRLLARRGEKLQPQSVT